MHVALDHARPGAGHVEHATRHLERVVGGLAQTPLAPGLFDGYVGSAWVVEQLCGDPSSAHDPNRRIDEALLTLLAVKPWRGHYDLISGLVGIGVYALERISRPSGQAVAARVIDRLGDLAKRRAPGLAWRTPPAIRAALPRGALTPEWNLGVAHGVPGVVGFLGRAVGELAPGRARDKALRLLTSAVDWVRAQELPRSSVARFPRGLPDEGTRPERLAWCYGDAGIAAALLVAARGTGNRDWERTALRVALAAAARPYETSGVVDAGLCHGAAGVAHCFHRMHLTTGEPRLATAARAWFGHTLRLRSLRRDALDRQPPLTHSRAEQL